MRSRSVLTPKRTRFEKLYYRARYYDPVTGRFLSEDEVGNDEGLNLYQYVGNAPIVSRDPTGLYQLKGFPPELENQMRDAIQEAIDTVNAGCKSCAGPAGPKIAKALKNATFVYKPDDHKNCGVERYFLWIKKIEVTAGAFDAKRCCRLASTLAHEADHYGANATDKDVAGSTYDMEKKCFGCGTGHPPEEPPKKPKTRGNP